MTVRERLSAALERASLLGKISLRRGLDFNPKGVATVVRTQLAGLTGPSAIYRVNAAMKPHGDALVFEGQTRSWRELDQRIDRLANGLRDRHGIGRGDRVVVVMRNRPEVVETQAALSRLGAGAVSVGWRSTPAELEYLITHSGA